MGRKGRRRNGKPFRQRLAGRLSGMLIRFRRRTAAPPPPIGMVDYAVATALQRVFDTEDEAVLGEDLQRLMLHLSHVEAPRDNQNHSIQRNQDQSRALRVAKRGIE